MAKEENRWLEVLSGQTKPNPKNNDEIEAAQLREAIGSYEKSIGLSKITPDNSYFRFQQILKSRESQKKTSTAETDNKSKKELFKLSLTALISLLIGTMLPLHMATRGNNDGFLDNIPKLFSSQLVLEEEINYKDTIKKSNPIESSNKIISTAIDEKLEVRVFKDRDIKLIIYGLKKNKNITLRSMIGVSNTIEGNIEITISHE